MGMTAAELELLGGMQAWADRNADAIGAALAEHTFTAGRRRRVPARLRERQGHRASPTSRRAGARAQAGHFKAIFARGRQAGGFGVSYFEGLLGVGALHSKINLPLKWFLGTYPVFLDLVHDAMRRRRRRSPRAVDQAAASAAASESVDLDGASPPPSARSAASSTTTRRRSSRPSTTTRSRRWA